MWKLCLKQNISEKFYNNTNSIHDIDFYVLTIVFNNEKARAR